MGSSFYRSFEERHRGSVEEIKRRLSFYLPFLAGLKDIYPDGVIADIGCGRGEWLEILTENGIANIGVDLDDGMLARSGSWAECAENGLSAVSAKSGGSEPDSVDRFSYC